MNWRYFTFHLTVTGERRNVSLDKELAEYLARHLELNKIEHTSIRLWAQNAIDSWMAFDPELPLSAQVRKLALRAIVRPELMDK